MKSIKSKLLISVMALAIAVTLATATTFAWFSMGSVATVRGIDLEIAMEGDIRINMVNTSGYVGYATWGTTVTLSTSDRLLQPVTIAKDTKIGALNAAGKYDITDATNGKYALPMKLRDGSKGATASDTTSRDYFKQDLYFASPYEYEVTMDAINLGSKEAPVQNSTASRSAALYHYITKDEAAPVDALNGNAPLVDDTSGTMFRIEFFYNNIDNHFMVETATGATYEIIFDYDYTLDELWYRVEGDATETRTKLNGTGVAGTSTNPYGWSNTTTTGYEIQAAFAIEIDGQAIDGTITIPEADTTFKQTHVALVFNGTVTDYVLRNGKSGFQIAELQYTATDEYGLPSVRADVVNYQLETPDAGIAIAKSFQITIDGKVVVGALNIPEDADYSADYIKLTLSTTGYTVMDAGYNLFAKAANSMRIAIVHHTFDGNGNGNTAHGYENAELIIYDPYSNSGWSYYNPFNMAHEAYVGDMAGILLEENYPATHKGLGRDAVTHAEGAVASDGKRTMVGTEAKIYEAQKPTFRLTDTGVMLGADEAVYGAYVSLYIWIEGTDADCMNAIAGYYIIGQLTFTGAINNVNP